MGGHSDLPPTYIAHEGDIPGPKKKKCSPEDLEPMRRMRSAVATTRVREEEELACGSHARVD
jgi:hypothetical protein